MVCLTVNTPHSWNCTGIASSWKQAVNSTIGHSPLPKDASCMPDGSLDDEISHDQETVSGEVHEERGGDKEVHEVRESDERAHRARAGCDGVCKAKESDDRPLKGGEDGNGVCKARESDNEVKESGKEMKESGNEAKESSNEAHKRRAMVNGDNIHVKMVSSNGKAGKDKVNEGE